MRSRGGPRGGLAGRKAALPMLSSVHQQSPNSSYRKAVLRPRGGFADVSDLPTDCPESVSCQKNAEGSPRRRVSRAGKTVPVRSRNSRNEPGRASPRADSPSGCNSHRPSPPWWSMLHNSWFRVSVVLTKPDQAGSFVVSTGREDNIGIGQAASRSALRMARLAGQDHLSSSPHNARMVSESAQGG